MRVLAGGQGPGGAGSACCRRRRRRRRRPRRGRRGEGSLEGLERAGRGRRRRVSIRFCSSPREHQRRADAGAEADVELDSEHRRRRDTTVLRGRAPRERRFVFFVVVLCFFRFFFLPFFLGSLGLPSCQRQQDPGKQGHPFFFVVAFVFSASMTPRQRLEVPSAERRGEPRRRRHPPPRDDVDSGGRPFLSSLFFFFYSHCPLFLFLPGSRDRPGGPLECLRREEGHRRERNRHLKSEPTYRPERRSRSSESLCGETHKESQARVEHHPLDPGLEFFKDPINYSFEELE